jgi:PleD family two-component response regulator
VVERDRRGSLSNRLGATTLLLAVEDDDDIAAFLRAYFRASGYDFERIDPVCAEDVVIAIDEHSPDCILLDYRLRGFSGHEAYRLIRSLDRFAFLPVIVVTADESARVRASTAATGIDGFEAKPFNVNTLADKVAERIVAAAELSTKGRDAVDGVMSHDYLDARLVDELATAAAAQEPLALALVRLRSASPLETFAGTEGLASVASRLISSGRAKLPHGAVLARTGADELAVLVPGTDARQVAGILGPVLAGLWGPLALTDGSQVAIDVVAGIAGYPQHAGAADALYMAADAALADALGSGAAVCVAL